MWWDHQIPPTYRIGGLMVVGGGPLLGRSMARPCPIPVVASVAARGSGASLGGLSGGAAAERRSTGAGEPLEEGGGCPTLLPLTSVAKWRPS